MTPDLADVLVMQSMIDTIVGIPKFSYPARQREAPKPAEEFAHIRVLEEYQVGIPKNVIISQDSSETVYKIYSPARLRFRIGVVDTTGLPSSKIMHGWTSEKMKELMTSSGYGFISCHPLSSEDALLEKEWEYRKGFSVEMYVTRTYEETVNTINGVVIGMKFAEGDLEEYLSTIVVNLN
jgi:hypothetical protein